MAQRGFLVPQPVGVVALLILVVAGSSGAEGAGEVFHFDNGVVKMRVMSDPPLTEFTARWTLDEGEAGFVKANAACKSFGLRLTVRDADGFRLFITVLETPTTDPRRAGATWTFDGAVPQIVRVPETGDLGAALIARRCP